LRHSVRSQGVLSWKRSGECPR